MSANSAANLANKDHKDFTYWTPDRSSSANKAAHLAAGVKAPEPWKAQQSQAGASAATIAAQKGVPNVSAAGVLASQVAPGTSHSASLRAATGAMSSARSAPPAEPQAEAYPDQANAASNALKAAATTTKRSQTAKSPTGLASDSMPIQETGAHIDTATLVPAAQRNAVRDVAAAMGQPGEDQRQAGLRAASISMAKRMYADQQSRQPSASALSAARTVRGRASFDSDEGKAPITYGSTLDEAARKAASERLAKLYDEHAAYRTYYGAEQPSHRRTSLIGRNRATSEDISDEAQARRIREQNKSLFQDRLSQVDTKQRDIDRAALMAAAQRNVKKQMAALDDQHAKDTGRVPPSLLADWTAKAQVTAQAKSDSRMENHGKVHIGGDTFMEQKDINAIAAANVAPTLNEINDKAEKHRQMEEEIRQRELARKQELEAKKREDTILKEERKRQEALTAEEKKQQKDVDKLHAKVTKGEEKRREREAKEELKRAHEEMKARGRLQKEEEKRAKLEKKDHGRREKEELKKSEG